VVYYEVPKNLIDLFKNTNAPADYGIEYWLYHDRLSKHDPRDMETYSYYYVIIYTSSSPVSYITQIIGDKTGDLQAIIMINDKRFYVWRKTDEQLDGRYIAKGAIVIDFLRVAPQYTNHFVRSLGYDV